MKMKSFSKKQSGFTLIELVVVIVILGILAAVALPRFVNLTNDATQGAVSGFAGAISSGNAINNATFLARGAGGANVINTTGGCSLVTANLLLQQAMPANPAYEVTTPAAALAVGTTVECTLRAGAVGAPTANFTLTGAN